MSGKKTARRIAKAAGAGVLFVSDVTADLLLASNRYWLVPSPRVAPLLEWWNLPVEPGTYWLGNGRVEKVDRGDVSSATVASTYVERRGGDHVPVAPVMVGGTKGIRTSHRPEHPPTMELEGGGLTAHLDLRFARWVAGGWPTDVLWTCRGKRKPVDAWSTSPSEREWLGCIMPVVFT